METDKGNKEKESDKCGQDWYFCLDTCIQVMSNS